MTTKPTALIRSMEAQHLRMEAATKAALDALTDYHQASRDAGDIYEHAVGGPSALHHLLCCEAESIRRRIEDMERQRLNQDKDYPKEFPW